MTIAVRSSTFSNDEIRERVRDLADRVLRPAAAEIDRTEEYPFSHARALRDLGIAGMTMPKAYGGRDVGFLGVTIAVEEAAKACGISGRIVVDTNMGAVPAIMAYGTEAQKRRTADLIHDADKPAICFSEPGAGSDATNMATKAVRRGDKYILNGTKHWITAYPFLCLFAGIIDIVILTNQPGYLDVIRFHFLLRDTVIADVRVGGHHDLPEIRGVGKYLLVAGHAGIKADLAGGGAYFSCGFAMKYSTVSQQ